MRGFNIFFWLPVGARSFDFVHVVVAGATTELGGEVIRRLLGCAVPQLPPPRTTTNRLRVGRVTALSETLAETSRIAVAFPSIQVRRHLERDDMPTRLFVASPVVALDARCDHVVRVGSFVDDGNVTVLRSTSASYVGDVAAVACVVLLARDTEPYRRVVDLDAEIYDITGNLPASPADVRSRRPQWRRRYRKLLPFQEVRKAARSLGFTTKDDWDDWVNDGKAAPRLGPYVPNKPDEFYADDWRGWADFLGAPRPFAEARDHARRLNLTSRRAWVAFAADHKDRIADLRLPAQPHKVYADDWRGYGDFLGSSSADDD
ncbi:hypothetical protein CTAYLR_001934 [Chrysophaeum taylorii]|uniref:Uncharacterized protein n=1 Tax=Chrysophaeum taylorii TaxID=2483200 RepID=A0AAD7U8N7_9STRA|nr:hypothetical protein CTAYLR_001934 [Chrysophaeum taylorii]